MRLLRVSSLLVLLPLSAWAAQDVVNTVHNLSSSGPGTFKSLTVNEVCVFCHTPHNANPSVPLWNHQLPQGQTYIQYGSTTLQARPGQPTGQSQLCLSCHDGTVALGALINLPQGVPTDLATTFLTGRANLGTDLANDHPVSFLYDALLQSKNPQLVQPAAINLPLENDQLQCTSCHDAHEKDIVPFLRKTTLNGQLCTTCHALSGTGWTWPISSHATSTATPRAANPWAERKPQWRGSNVVQNACFGCHTPHNAVTPQRLVKNQEENTCFLCHNGSVARTNIESETLAKPSRHPVQSSLGIHDPTENFATGRPSNHVECADCHNAHAVTSATASAPFVSGMVTGVSGITSSRAQVANATNLYEVCFKCHADINVVPVATVPRWIDEINTRLEFDTANPSFHPVEGPGRNPNVPSLIPPRTTNSLVYCTDCHNNDSGPGAGGGGPKGPHGSLYRPLLERNYSTADNTPESAFSYALCYKCHNRNSILRNDSFKEHQKHVVGENAPCSACHDAHGIPFFRGNATNNSKLINFDLSIVRKNRFATPVFEATGLFHGRCDLICHGQRHDYESY